MSVDFDRLREIFLAALEQAPDQREAYLDQMCAGNEELRRNVAVMLQAQALGEGPLDRAALQDEQTGAHEQVVSEGAGTVIGPYKLLEQIGEGGMGTVWMAQQTEPVKRLVAIKLIKAGMDSKQVIARFEAERQALALMDHPNIAKVLDGGTTGKPDALARESAVPLAYASGSFGRPYFVMDLVKGVPITKYCDEHHLTPRQRLELFVPVCQAVQHAHQKGIIHRDLKPSNVLVALYDGKPVPKVIDFGVAKATGQALTDRTLVTGFGNIVGTLEYMSPEQAEINQLDIDTRSDIYSLGVLLYELLTGTTPLEHKRVDRSGILEALRIIREEEPPTLSSRLATTEELPAIAMKRGLDPTKLTKLFRGELDWIVMKALEKYRTRRYENVNAFAADVQRYLNDEAVQACPPSLSYRLRKFVRRNRGPVLAAALVLLALVGGIIGTTWGMLRATWAEADAVAEAKLKEQERDNTRHQLFKAKLAEATASRRSRDTGQRFATWKALTEAAALAGELNFDEEVFLKLRNEAIACLALADVRTIKEWEAFASGSPGHLAFDADLEHYARSDLKGNISIRRVSDDQQVARLPGQGDGGGKSGADVMRFNPHGNLLAVRNWHHLPGKPTNFQLWDWRRETSVFEPPFLVHTHDFSPDGRHGRQLALGHENNTLTVHEVPTGQEVRRISLGSAPQHVAFHPDGSRIAVASYQGREVEVRDVIRGNLIQKLTLPEGAWAVAWHADGVLLAAACQDRNVYVWDTATWQQHSILKGHEAAVVGVAFAPGGDLLLSMAWDSTSRLWDPWTGRELFRLPDIAQFFSRDGGRLANQSGTKAVVLELAAGRECRTLPKSGATPKEALRRGGFSPDGCWLALATNERVRLWDLARGKENAFLTGSTTHDVQFHPTGTELLTSGSDGLFSWPLQTHEGARRIGPARQLLRPGAGSWFGWFSLDEQGRTAAIFEPYSRGGWVVDLKDPRAKTRLLGDYSTLGTAISPDGRWVAAGTFGGFGVRVWDAHTGKFLQRLLEDERAATVAFSPDSRWLVTGVGAAFDIWKTHPTDSWKVMWHIGREHGGRHAGRAAFAPDGKVLAITLSPSVVQLLDATTRRPLARLQPPDTSPIDWLAFSPDGSQLVVTTQSNTVRLWDLRLIREQLQKIGLDWDQDPYAPASPLGTKRVNIEVDLGDLNPERGTKLKKD